MKKKYSLRKSKKILKDIYSYYKRKKKNIPSSEQSFFEKNLLSLQEAINNKDKEKATAIINILQVPSEKYLKKTLFDHVFDFSLAIIVALALAIVVRQTWFEPYTVPTGSMRPTIKEHDHLLVSKTAFSINTLTPTKHLYFDNSLVKRGSIIVLSSDNLDGVDSEYRYFYIFPGKKQFVKRLIAKPGDTLYFHGGKLYGIDKDDNEIDEYKNDIFSKELEHIPFNQFESKALTPNAKNYYQTYSPVTIYQMNEPLVKLDISPSGQILGNVLYNKNVSHVKDLWGIKNYAMTRIVFHKNSKQENYYLELLHSPTETNASLIKDEFGRLRPSLHYEKTLIPLNKDDLKNILDHVYTSRFIVKNGSVFRYGGSKNPIFSPKVKNIPNGCYEFDKGQAYKITLGGIAIKLPSNHPIYNENPEYIKMLFNLGITFNVLSIDEHSSSHFHFPQRYAYFRDDNLYLMNFPIFKKNSPTLIRFLEKEHNKQLKNSLTHYSPFEESKPPFDENGKLDVNFIKKHGLKVPEKMYLALGDNHAASSDCRDFGFVPEVNLRGVATFLIWPIGPRWGFLPQISGSVINLPRIIIWTIAGIVSFIYVVYKKRKKTRPLKF